MLKIFFYLIGVGLFLSTGLFAQENSNEKNPQSWYQLGSSYEGIDLQDAYHYLKENPRKSNQIIVGVIDSGIDTTHEDLKPILWTNPKEIPGNGIDDDKNGYIDDVHGWNFLGGKDGRNVQKDSYEAARVYYNLKPKWRNKTVDTTTLSAADLEEYKTYLRAENKVMGGNKEINDMEVIMLKRMLTVMKIADSTLQIAMDKKEYTGNDLDTLKPQNADDKRAKEVMYSILKSLGDLESTNTSVIRDLSSYISSEEEKIASRDNAPEPYRAEIVKDNENDINDRDYGNNDIMTGTAFHGTHCSGIIAAVRNNNKGMDGIADNVRIMMVRAVPDGDEHDKDVANAIRYAVDNGARIISMSFGKPFSPQKQWVDDAFKYAESKGVLLVCAAGNDSKNVDVNPFYPNRYYKDHSGSASNVIVVGASGNQLNGGLVASFSNYGKNSVDVFAPGVDIYSTIPGGNKYGNASGTSMAAPVVSGIAALILEHFPNFTPQQLIYVIEHSVQIPKEQVEMPGTDEKVNLSDLCKTGGIVNAYDAIKFAYQYNKQLQSNNKPSKKGVDQKKLPIGKNLN